MTSVKRRAFTLIELLVVISLIGLLVALVVPTMGRVRELARRTACAANLSAIGKGAYAYATENNGSFPSVPGNAANCTQAWFMLTKGSGASQYCQLGNFACPSDAAVASLDYLTAGLPDFNPPPTGFLHAESYSLQVTNIDQPTGSGICPNLTDSGALVIGADYSPGVAGGADNSPNHRKEGQNTLRLDTVVGFKTTPNCGIFKNGVDDNIWTSNAGGACPGDRNDSFLKP